jgi:hypothetical protein
MHHRLANTEPAEVFEESHVLHLDERQEPPHTPIHHELFGQSAQVRPYSSPLPPVRWSHRESAPVPNTVLRREASYGTDDCARLFLNRHDMDRLFVRGVPIGTLEEFLLVDKHRVPDGEMPFQFGGGGSDSIGNG